MQLKEQVTHLLREPKKLNTPILFMVFNRPEITALVFEAIRQAQPCTLYIAADGPRAEKVGELEKCLEVRKIVQKINWPCNVKTLFREKNLGCKTAVSSAIDWFFENEEEGIILEDDVVPHHSFFSFCNALLIKYRHDNRVMMISGFNPLGKNVKNNSYFFSEYPAIWGWATWRSRWNLFDINLSHWGTPELTAYLNHKLPGYVYKYFDMAFRDVKKSKINAWGYSWAYTILSNHGLVVKPFANLIQNIGIAGTHAKKRDSNHFVAYGEILIDKLVHPQMVIPSVLEDAKFYKTIILKVYVKNNIIKMIRAFGLVGLLKYLASGKKKLCSASF